MSDSRLAALIARMCDEYDMSETQAMEAVVDAATTALFSDTVPKARQELVADAAARHDPREWTKLGLDTKQAAVLTAFASGKSVTLALKEARISSSTYSRWLRSKTFRAARDALFAHCGRVSRAKSV